MTLLPELSRGFEFQSTSYDEQSGELALGYCVGGLSVFERLVFPDPPALTAQQRLSLGPAIRLLHMLAGVSYYKTVIGAKISFVGVSLSDAWADFGQAVYVHGLAEFAFQHQLQIEGMIDFPGKGEDEPAPLVDGREEASHRNQACLVAMGGGKDSLLAVELLREAGQEISLCYVGGSPVIAQVAESTGLPVIAISRQLAPQLLEWNALGARNGHVPVTAINSAILLCAAVIYGFDRVVFANEKSADEPTRIRAGVSVNHQYSKGLAFERRLSELVARDINPDITYFSLLRPLHELGICKRFASIARYDAVFTSCNRNFHLAGSAIGGRWCGHCPKCQFVFLALAPFVDRRRLLGIFGSNLLDDSSQINGFKALMGLGEGKPFECVGTAEEARAAMAALSRQQAWQADAVVVSFLGGWFDAWPATRSIEQLCRAGGESLIPEDLRRMSGF